ncbi:AbrB family transcriptional regulator [Pseudalkalibacillus sp. R45]|uniref:AbrB family transcriptional regulator n=1 Tax=Pseudalkalibacillus sp. R45 TaxID=3457433 RepID=UPI003FCE387F
MSHVIILPFIIFAVFAIIGSLCGYYLKIPMGTVLGATVMVGVGKSLQLIEFQPSNYLSFLVQISLGIMIGLSFTKLSKKQLSKLNKSLVFVMVVVIIMTVSTGFIVSYFNSVTVPVAVLSSAPGGMVEMATMAGALGLEVPAVIFLHFVRLLIVMVIFPHIIGRITKISEPESPALKKKRHSNMQNDINKTKISSGRPYLKYIVLILASLAAGLVGFITKLPLGPLLGAMALVIVINFKTEMYSPLPIRVKRLIQTFIGGSIGLTFTSETFQLLQKLVMPALLISLLTIVSSVILAFILTKWLKVDQITSVCGLAPAGMSEMVLIAEERNANVPTVVTMHLFRILTIVTIIPFIVQQLI